MTKVITGSEPVDKLPMGGIEIRKRDKWDGKDAEPIVEEPEPEETEELWNGLAISKQTTRFTI